MKIVPYKIETLTLYYEAMKSLFSPDVSTLTTDLTDIHGDYASISIREGIVEGAENAVNFLNSVTVVQVRSLSQ